MKVNVKNERVKRQFLRWLKDANKCCEATVDSVAKAICLYEDFTKHEDFALFSPDRAMDFKQWLSRRETKGKPLSVVTYCTYLRYLRKFFTWLSWQRGYKSRITPAIVAYLTVTEKEERVAAQTTLRNYPSLDYVLQLASSIAGQTEIDRRDRALIAFTLLSGMRDKAIATLPLGCFDETTLLIQQNPRLGVQTKFAKFIPTTLFEFDPQLLSYVMDWVRYLRSKGFGAQDPIFPRAKTSQGTDGMSFESAVDVEPVFWHGAGRIREIFKQRAAAAQLPYFPPHTFRHLAVHLALKSCKHGEHIKAVSQNFGHEYVATTLSSYANFAPQQLASVLHGMDFSKPANDPDNGKLDAIRKILDESR